MIHKKNVDKIFLLLLSLTVVFQLKGQERLGLPKILNFSKNDYKAATMNWATVKGSRGKVYFANNYGLICYDGYQWDLILEPDNRTNIFSLAIDYNDVIYIGAEGDMGYSIRNSIGQINYQSLNPLIPAEHKQYSLVWNIIVQGSEIYYFTDHKIFIYDGITVKVLPFGDKLIFSQKINGELYIQQRNSGLKKLNKNGELVPLDGTLSLMNSEVRFLCALENSIIIVTSENGLFTYSNGSIQEWNTELTRPLSSMKINTCKQLSNGKLALGTMKDGLVIVDGKGQISLYLNKKNGLRNNTVTGILEDQDNNIWLALANGISYVEVGSDFYYLDDRFGLSGSVYSTAIHQDHFYVATNQGVLSRPLDNIQGQFEFIGATEAHTWSLSVVQNQLLIGNHDGAFEIVENKVSPINDSKNGAWQFIKVPGRDDLLLQGSYKGIYLLVKNGGDWEVSHKLKGFEETAREMVLDRHGNLWVGHGYKGIYKLKLDKEYSAIERIQLYDTSKGLPDNNWNNLFILRNQLLIGTQRGVFEYNEFKDQFQPHEHFQNLLGSDQLIRRLIETPKGDLLFIKGLDNEDQIGIIKEAGNSYEIQTIPFQKLKGELIPAFESIRFYKDQMLIGAKDGLIVYKQGNPRNQEFHTNIRTVFSSNANDSIIYGHPFEFDPSEFGDRFVQQLPYDENALKIAYYASSFDMADNLLFRTYLEGYEEDWTGWTHATSREFTNLKEGTYTFYVESKNVYDHIGEKDKFQFIVHPPWYRTIYMKILYIILGILFIYIFQKVRILRLKAYKLKQLREVRRQRGELMRQNSKQEQQMIQLQMEKLKSEVEFKSRELASSTLHNAHQNESVLKVLKQIESIDSVKDPKALKELSNVKKFLKEMIDQEQNWDQFEQHFNELHNDFIRRIKNKFPSLTARDIRLCAYLRMNLVSKEIAPLMGISYRGVEALRYRIRKKFKLENGDNLVSYILEF